MVSYSAPQRYQLARQAGFNQQDAIVQTAISLTEDGSGDPAALSPTQDLGLNQINQIWWAQFGGATALMDPLTNFVAALKIKAIQGWNAWTTFRNGTYTANLPAARAAAQQVESGNFDPGTPPTIGPTTQPALLTNVPISTLAGTTSQQISKSTQQSQDVASSTAGGTTGAIQNAAKGIGAIGTSLGNLATLLSNVVGALFDTRFWWRILLVLLGIAAVGIGLFLYLRPSVESALKGAA